MNVPGGPRGRIAVYQSHRRSMNEEGGSTLATALWSAAAEFGGSRGERRHRFRSGTVFSRIPPRCRALSTPLPPHSKTLRISVPILRTGAPKPTGPRFDKLLHRVLFRCARTLTSTLFACAVILFPSLPPLVAASTTAVLDAGGRRVTSANCTLDGSLGSLGGMTAAVSPPVVARHGYAGQLYDVQTLVLSASPAAVSETGATQLGAKAILDDSTFLSLAPSSVTWSIVSGPIAFISTGGLARATNVYQNTVATVCADYQSRFGTLSLTVLNVGNDDFGPYARDGIDDAWQVRYFGLNNPNAGPSSDPDHDGVDNYHEYVADTNPTNALSWFQIQSVSNAANLKVSYLSSSSRKYTLYYRTNLTSGGWTNLPSQTDLPGSGGPDTLTDPSPVGPRRFYRVGVRLP